MKKRNKAETQAEIAALGFVHTAKFISDGANPAKNEKKKLRRIRKMKSVDVFNCNIMDSSIRADSLDELMSAVVQYVEKINAVPAAVSEKLAEIENNEILKRQIQEEISYIDEEIKRLYKNVRGEGYGL